jgi:hypothetical protein
MTDEQGQEQKKKGSKPIGGISQYATLGHKRSDVQTATSSDFQTSRLPDVEIASTPNVKRSKHPEWKQQTIYLPPTLTKWLKLHAVQVELEISEVMALALKEYQERHS